MQDPCFVQIEKEKHYILPLTCAATRALHLELVSSLSMEDFLLAFRRFAASRGMPSVITSDNAKAFVAAKQALSDMYGGLAPEWRYIVPRSPWWGGWWERLVRSVKSGLKKTLGCRSVARTELETLLHEIEATVNSRPLTFVGDDIQDRTPLTPAHFLIGRSSLFIPEQLNKEETETTSEDLRRRLVVKNHLLNRFWSTWSKEYIRHLPQCTGGGVAPSVCQGDLVLIREDNCSRLKWPLGIVEELFPGKDGVVRAVKVRTKAGSYSRPIQRLYNLEVWKIVERAHRSTLFWRILGSMSSLSL